MITLEKAHRIIAAAEPKATEFQQPMNITVVDVGTNLKAFIRMDGAWLGASTLQSARRPDAVLCRRQSHDKQSVDVNQTTSGFDAILDQMAARV